MSSNLLPPGGQEELPLSGPDAAFFENLEAQGEFTGERFFRERPAAYRRAVALLARGIGPARIAELIGGVSKNTIRAIRVREGQTIDLLRGMLGERAYTLAEDALDGAIVVMQEIMADPERRSAMNMTDVKAMLVSAGIAIENAQLLTGGATIRVNYQPIQQPEHADFNAYLASLQSAAPMGLAGETGGQKSGEGNEGKTGSLAADAPEGLKPPPADSQSEG